MQRHQLGSAVLCVKIPNCGFFLTLSSSPSPSVGFLSFHLCHYYLDTTWKGRNMLLPLYCKVNLYALVKNKIISTVLSSNSPHDGGHVFWKKWHKTRGWKHNCVGQILAVVAVVLVIIFWSFHSAPDIMRLEVKLSKTEISLRVEGLSMLFKWGRSIDRPKIKRMATWKSSGSKVSDNCFLVLT